MDEERAREIYSGGRNRAVEKNVQQKEGAQARVRSAADSIAHGFQVGVWQKN